MRKQFIIFEWAFSLMQMYFPCATNPMSPQIATTNQLGLDNVA